MLYLANKLDFFTNGLIKKSNLDYVSKSGLFEISRKELPILTPTAYSSLLTPLSDQDFQCQPA